MPFHAHAESLADAWQQALAVHQQLAASAARRDAAALDASSARAERRPRLDVNSAFTQLDEAPAFDFGGGMTSRPIFSADNFTTAGVQLSIPVYTGGAIRAGIDAASGAADASSHQYGAAVQDIKLGAGEHFVQVLRAESALTVARSNVATLEAHTANAKKRFDVGDVPQNDFLAASVALANARQGQLQAENALDNARAAYNRFLGRPMNQPVSLDPDLGIDDLVAPAGNLEALLARARENRVELDAMAAQAVALRARSKAVRAQSRPQLALTGGYMYLENAFLTADEFWMTGVAVQWNPFDGGRNRDRAAALEKRAAAMTHSRNDLESMIALQVRRAWNDRGEAESRIAVTAAAVSQAAENLRVVRNRYDAGASMNTEVLDAEALRQQALNNRDDARYGFALAQLRLARAAGEL